MASCNYCFYVFAAVCLVACRAAPAENKDAILKIPSACKGQSFCSIKPDGYDQLEEKINKALPEFLLEDIGDRYGPSDEPRLSPKEDWHNCPYVTKTQSMFLYNHGGNDTKIEIFVQTKLFKQYVDVVTCATEHIAVDSNEQCFQNLGVSSFHMKSTCVSSSAKRTLYVYDIENSKVVQKSFDVPACCKCKITYDN